MQTTLLGLAIALILALLAALVGPHFVNWNNHRAFFEAEASRLVGVDVKVAGDIDATILPVPAVTLGEIAVGASGEVSRMRAKSLRIELGLGPLMRGELRATEMKLVAPQAAIGLDSRGRIDWPSLALASETLSIDLLSVENGQVVLTDAKSGVRTVLDQLWFTGEVRSLTGPIRGKGEFVSSGGLYGYELSAGRYGAEGARLRLALKTDERPLTVEADGLLAFDKASPRFDGTLTLSRPAGAVLASGKTVAVEPWRLSTKVKADIAAAALEEVSFQYGPDERAVMLAGTGEFQFGQHPHMRASLAARQIDLDRLLASVGTPRRLPLSAVQAFGEMASSALRPSWPVTLALNVDAMTVGGGTAQAVSTELRSDGATWTVDKLELRAPGFTHIKMDGRLFALGKGLGFVGGAAIDSNDPRNLMAWLGGNPPVAAQIKPWHAIGDVTLSADRIAIERLQTQLDRGKFEGSLAYVWPADGKAARLEADVRAETLDFDGMFDLARHALSGLGLERPEDMKLAFEVDRARLAGFDARTIVARLTVDRDGLAIERLSIGDFGDSNLVATGRIQTSSPPGGSVTVYLDARDLGGIIAVAEKFAPAAAAPLRRLAARQKSATLRAAISLGAAGSDMATGKVEIGGQLGAVRVNLTADATGKRDLFSFADPGALGGAEARVTGQFESDEASALLAMLGLERSMPAASGPGRLTLSARGPLARDLSVEAALRAGVIDVDGRGTFKRAPDRPSVLSFDRLEGVVAGGKVAGRLALRLGDSPRLDGAIDAETFDAPAVVAAAIGAPVRRDTGTGWSVEPFRWNSPQIDGRIEVTAQRATLLPGVVAQRLRGVARFGASEVAFEDLNGELAKGHVEGRLAISNGDDGVSARLRAVLSGANPGEMFGAQGRESLSGSMALQTEIEGAGRSPAAFMGSLTGFGSLKLEKAAVRGLNPGVFGAVTRAGELGIPLDGNRLREFVTGVLDSAPLRIEAASANIGIGDGQAKLNDVAIKAAGADLQASARLDLSDASLDARLTLNGPQAAGTSRPTLLVTLKGPMLAPARTIDAGALTGWLTIRAIEQQSKQIDVLERAGREAPASPKPVDPATDNLPSGGVPSADSRRDSDARAPTLAPALPPPVNVPASPGPRAAPRADGAVFPGQAPSPRGLVGAQN